MKAILLTILILASFPLYAQFDGKDFSVSVNYNFTTTSKLFLQPNSPDPIIRETHEDLEDISHYSAEFRYALSDIIQVGIGTEYIQKSYINRNYNLSGTLAELKDGYKVIPVELSIYYLLPFSVESFKFMMGGGGGLYFGSHIRELGDLTVSTFDRNIGYGIHVMVGIDYLINQSFSVRGQMRFRDPEFQMKNKYSDRIVTYNGNAYLLATDTFTSKVNIDGVTFTIGVVFQF